MFMILYCIVISRLPSQAVGFPVSTIQVIAVFANGTTAFPVGTTITSTADGNRAVSKAIAFPIPCPAYDIYDVVFVAYGVTTFSILSKTTFISYILFTQGDGSIVTGEVFPVNISAEVIVILSVAGSSRFMIAQSLTYFTSSISPLANTSITM